MTVLPENILRRMSPEDRKTLGKAGQTAAEAGAVADKRAERILQREIAQYLNLRGIAYGWARTDKRSTYTESWPDFTCAVNGTPVAFEVKNATGKPTAEQEKCHEAMRGNGWQVFVVRSLAEVKAVVDDPPPIVPIPAPPRLRLHD